jgi:hypothetical protein
VARIRTIKPQFFTDDELAELPAITRLFFIGLWTQADVAGRMACRPKRLKAEILPYDDCDVDEILDGLEGAGFVTRYEVDGSGYLWIPTFRKHQRITGKEAETPSEFPRCPQDSDPELLGKHRGNTGETPGKQLGNQDGDHWGNTGETPGKQLGNQDGDHLGNTGETPGNAGREGKGKEGKESLPPYPQMGDEEETDPDENLSPTVQTHDTPKHLTTAQVFCWVPIKGGPDQPITLDKLAEWRHAFPGRDIEAEAKSAAQWHIDNGLPWKNAVRGVGNWLRRAKPAQVTPAGQSSNGTTTTAYERFIVMTRRITTYTDDDLRATAQAAKGERPDMAQAIDDWTHQLLTTREDTANV